MLYKYTGMTINGNVFKFAEGKAIEVHGQGSVWTNNEFAFNGFIGRLNCTNFGCFLSGFLIYSDNFHHVVVK